MRDVVGEEGLDRLLTGVVRSACVIHLLALLCTHTTQLLDDARNLLPKGLIKSVQVEVEKGKGLEELLSPLLLSLYLLSFSLQSIILCHS